MSHIFESPKEFIDFLSDIKRKDFFSSSKGLKLLDSIVYSIETAIIDNKRTAPLFEMEFESNSTTFSILSTKSNWKPILKKCMEYYQEAEQYDRAIDTYQVLKKLDKKKKK